MFQYSHYDPTCWLNLAPDMTFLESFPFYIYIYIYIHLPSKQWKTYFGLFIRNVKVSFDKKKNSSSELVFRSLEDALYLIG